jgi:hypothetical protein
MIASWNFPLSKYFFPLFKYWSFLTLGSVEHADKKTNPNIRGTKALQRMNLIVQTEWYQTAAALKSPPNRKTSARF